MHLWTGDLQSRLNVFRQAPAGEIEPRLRERGKSLEGSETMKNVPSPIVLLQLSLAFFFANPASSQTYPPSCVVTAPHSNSYVKVGANVVINAYATDIGKTKNNGTVTKVEFLVDGAKVGESSTATNNTYTYIWKCEKAGEYLIAAKATNNTGVSFTSAGQYVTAGTKDPTAIGMSAGRGKYLANIVASSPGQKYTEYWNGATAENACKWGSVEGTRDSYSWTGAEVVYNFAKNNNLMFRYHAIAWGNQTPAWLEGLQTNQTDFKAELEEYITLIASRYKYVDQVDVLNEQIGTHAPNTPWFRAGLGGAGTTGYDWAVYLFERARKLLPNTKLVLNDYGLEGSNTNIDAQLALAAVLRDRGLIDGYGTQAHCFSIDTRTASGLKSDLDRMAKGGIPIYVTELDIRGTGGYTETTQANVYKALFPVYWEHPAVGGVTLWGYITGSTWMDNTGIMNTNGTERQALTYLKSYLQGKANVGYPFGPGPTSGVGEVAKSPSISVAYHAGALRVEGASAGAKVSVYDMRGELVSAFGNQGGSLSRAERGVLVVNIAEPSGATSQHRVLAY